MKIIKEVYLFEFANWSKEKSGFKRDVWFDSEGKNRKVPHSGIRYKVQLHDESRNADFGIDNTNYNNIDLTKESEAKEIIDFINNKASKLVASHWNKEITDDELLIALKDVRAGIPEEEVIKELELKHHPVELVVLEIPYVKYKREYYDAEPLTNSYDAKSHTIRIHVDRAQVKDEDVDKIIQ